MWIYASIKFAAILMAFFAVMVYKEKQGFNSIKSPKERSVKVLYFPKECRIIPVKH